MNMLFKTSSGYRKVEATEMEQNNGFEMLVVTIEVAPVV